MKAAIVSGPSRAMIASISLMSRSQNSAFALAIVREAEIVRAACMNHAGEGQIERLVIGRDACQAARRHCHAVVFTLAGDAIFFLAGSPRRLL